MGGKFSGVQDLFRAMRGIPQACETTIDEELTGAADGMVARAKQLVDKKSGKLAATIHNVVERKSDGNLKVTVIAGDKGSPEATWLEFGHMGPGNIRVSAHPFFFPAYHQIVTPMKRRLADRLGMAIDEKAANG